MTEAEEILAEYAAAFDEVGLTISITRAGVAYSGIRARVVKYGEQEIAGTVQQGDQTVIAFAPDFVTAGFPIPPKSGDKITVSGRIITVTSTDANTRKIGETIAAYEITCRGQ